MSLKIIRYKKTTNLVLVNNCRRSTLKIGNGDETKNTFKFMASTYVTHRVFSNWHHYR
jgi:hypothetical protein